MMSSRDAQTVLIIGGGVAGSSCAIGLRQRGIEVTVVEKAVYPRDKVCGCCIGGNGLAALQKLSLHEWALDVGESTHQWSGSLGGQLVEIPLPRGIAISRQSLDEKLLQHAIKLGADARQPSTVSSVSIHPDSVTAEIETNGITVKQEFALVIVASGLNSGGYQDILPWSEPPNGPFGVSWTAESDSIEPGVIYMACDNDGYVGLVQLENGRVDIAAALTSGSGAASGGTPVTRVESILSRSEFPKWSFHNPSQVLTTPPLRRSRVAGKGRVLAIGDAAGYVEPFTGEGMTWAMQSGIAAADQIAAACNTSTSPDISQVGDLWDHHLQRLLKSKKRTCRIVTSMLRRPIARHAAGHMLSRWPSLAKPLIQKLSEAT